MTPVASVQAKEDAQRPRALVRRPVRALNSVQCHVDCSVVFSVVFSEHYIRNKQAVYGLAATAFLFSCFQINVFNMFSAQSMCRNLECVHDGLQATVPPEKSPTLMVK